MHDRMPAWIRHGIRIIVFAAWALAGLHRTAHAQVAGGKIIVDNLSVQESGGRVSITFGAHIDFRTVADKELFIFAPVLTDGRYSVSLPAVIVTGRRIKNARERREWAAGYTMDYPGAIHTANGRSIHYRNSVEWQDWMNGATLQVESVSAVCTSYERLPVVKLKENIWLRDTTARGEILPEPAKPKTTAEILAETFPFVEPESAYDPNEPFKLYEEEGGHSLTIYYPLGTYRIDSDYLDNARSLTNLSAAIEMIADAQDSDISRIVVAGFTSPEGRLDYNNRLAFERAVSVKEYIMQDTGFPDEGIQVFNGSIDWQGLKALVARSSLREKEEIIDLIDHSPVTSDDPELSRLDRLRKLNGGRTYQKLVREYFPYLRKGAFIRVYYKKA